MRITAEREARRLVIALDCNLRPALVGPLNAWQQRIEQIAQRAAIIKLSAEDFAGGWGEEADIEEYATRWLDQGTKLVVMTRGANGATAWHRCGNVTVPAVPVRLSDTVGAGDSFQAALLGRLAKKGRLNHCGLAMLDEASIFDSLHYANVAASLSCERRGADLPTQADIEAKMPMRADERD